MSISNHASRWIVAAVAAPILLGIIFLAPPVFFFGIVALFGALAWFEFFAVVFGPDAPRSLLLVAIAGWLLTAAGAFWHGTIGQIGGLFAAMAMGMVYFVFRYEHIAFITNQAGRFALGHAYLSLFFSCLIPVFLSDHGPSWILFTLLVTFLGGDTMAFYAGRTFGRRPLYPAISPKKTWEGLAGGVLASGVVAAITAALLLPVPWYHVLPLGLFMGLWASVGDLLESMLKRAANVKDSGTLLMGHGGVWDRIDALTFNAPLVFLFIAFYSGEAVPV
jgi:phosphatidate cytidylyltransferase